MSFEYIGLQANFNQWEFSRLIQSFFYFVYLPKSEWVRNHSIQKQDVWEFVRGEIIKVDKMRGVLVWWMGNRSTEKKKKKDIWNLKRELEHNMFREKLIWKLLREEYHVNIKFSFTFIYGFWTTCSITFWRVFYIQFLC